ncbi:hypothetical protein AKJ09_01914 [Labilithrix luteola]|uniref:Uncharacterized protein n=1 Tax=Labilithrix luteola TaxID=1391654 RepID=A0A0K1PNZ1_9BACT|nr:hypothetical protein [Labilithrix luteola]AKU95250.1 hypothetical protein AKJ09_01914 [Labilithrix luteola]
MRFGGLVAIALSLALALTATTTRADEPETVALAYRVPKGCPDEKAFTSAVASRTPKARFAKEVPHGRRFVVDVRRTGAGFAGRLVVEESGERATREVTSGRCEDLVEAFVLFTAIAIDPSASLVPPAPEPPPPAEEPVPPLEESPPIAALPPPRERRAPSRPPPAPKPVWHLTVGSGAYVATGIADGGMVSVYPVADLSSTRRGLSPSARLGLVWANSDGQQAPSGSFTFGLRALVLSACAIHVRLGTEVAPSLRLCGAFEGGALLVRPYALVLPNDTNRPWFAAGPLVRIGLPLLPGRLDVSADAGFVVPFEREQVFLRPGPTVATVDSVGARVSATLNLRLF